MLLGILGSLELSSLVPGSWRLSASLVLQTTLAALVVYVIIRVARLIQHTRWLKKTFGDFPGPKKRHWLYGSFYYFPKTSPEARLLHFRDLVEEYGQKGYFLLWRGLYSTPIIVVCAPHTMGRILKTAEPKPQGIAGSYRMLKPWLGNGLLVAGGNEWARNRRLLTPAFHFGILKPYVNIYNKAADVFIENLNRYAQDGTKFELFQECCKCTLDIILKCAFSFDIDVQRHGETNPYVRAVTDLSNAIVSRVRHPYLYPDVMWNLSSTGRQFKKDCDYVHSMAEDIINKRRLVLEAEGEEGILKGRKYLDFLDILLTAKDENGKGLSPMEIRNEVDTFLFEGHDTTASALSWILYSLAEHQEYQKNCQDEIDEILRGRDTDDLEWNDLHKMEYLTMCIKEGLRLHCPVAIVAREVEKEFNIGDRVIPKDTQIQINIWALHHNKRVWERDMEYIPERFLEENVLKMDHYQFVPFSAGPSWPNVHQILQKCAVAGEVQLILRNCIGQQFAMNEEKVVIAKLLRNFTFELAPGHVVKKRLAAVMRAENGIMVYVKRRNHN